MEVELGDLYATDLRTATVIYSNTQAFTPTMLWRLGAKLGTELRRGAKTTRHDGQEDGTVPRAFILGRPLAAHCHGLRAAKSVGGANDPLH